ncbi:MAG: sigma-54-dependent Fis family transcriptional regulator [Myxococcales bacterium]|nr:sigma-54-dependent Fis family transcriptional regulator [Myxococcales bacterium]
MSASRTAARVLVVDDEPSLRQLVRVLLQRAGHEVVEAADVGSARDVIESSPVAFDLVVTDLIMPGGSGLDVIRAARSRSPETQVLVVTAHATVETAVEAMQLGAYGYVEKPLDLATARAHVDKALEKRALLRDNEQLKALSRTPRVGLPGDVLLIGRSAALEAALDLVRRAASSKANVLITGESGTGKEVFARALHALSDRSAKPMLVVNCGAIPGELLESELFGHEKGAFTSAHAKREGLFREASGGTLFLDEIGELPLALQVKLLRVLQEKRVRAVGATQEVAVDVRIVAATNRDLEGEVKAGRFRQDLFYRLNVLRVSLPSLRERSEDILLLAEHFRARFSSEHGRQFLAFSPDALAALVRYPFPGNVRELENAVERAVALAAGATIEARDLPPEIVGHIATSDAAVVLPDDGMNLEKYLEDVERTLLTQALSRANGVRTKAAALLGLSFRSFRYRLAKMGLAKDEDDVKGGLE